MSQQMQAANDAPTQAFQLQRVYLKGASLEMPNAPEIFLQQGEVRMEVNVVAENRVLDANVYEVVLRATVTSKLGDKTVYLLEIDQAGIVEAQNIPADMLDQLLEISAPAVLTGYLRVAVSDVLTRATLPMFFLPEINWAQGYQDKRQQLMAGVTPAAVLRAPTAVR